MPDEGASHGKGGSHPKHGEQEKGEDAHLDIHLKVKVVLQSPADKSNTLCDTSLRRLLTTVDSPIFPQSFCNLGMSSMKTERKQMIMNQMKQMIIKQMKQMKQMMMNLAATVGMSSMKTEGKQMIM